MPASDSSLLWTDWYRNCWKRWPMLLGTWIGLVLAIYTTMTGYGWHLAKSRLPESRAAAIARNQPPVPVAENAAVVYDQAVASMVSWETLSERMRERNWTEKDAPERLKAEEWEKSETYTMDAPVRVMVGANGKAIRLAIDGTQQARIDWGIRAEELPTTKFERIPRAAQLGRLLTQDAMIAGHDGDWERAVVRLLSACTLTDHLYTGVAFTSHLTAMSTDMLVARRAALLLVIPGSQADERTLGRLKDIALDRSKPRWSDLIRVMQDEEAVNLHTIDHLGCGDVAFLADTGGINTISLPVNFYSATYPWDRSAMADRMRDMQDGLTSRMTGIPAGRPLMHHELAFSTDPRLVYGRLSGKLLTGLLLPVFDLAVGFELGREMRWRLLHLVIRLRERAASDGRIPENFTAAGIPAADAIDLMTHAKSEPVRFRREDGGLLRVWSVGNNRKDDTTTPPTSPGRNDDISVVIRLSEKTP